MPSGCCKSGGGNRGDKSSGLALVLNLSRLLYIMTILYRSDCVRDSSYTMSVVVFDPIFMGSPWLEADESGLF